MKNFKWDTVHLSGSKDCETTSGRDAAQCLRWTNFLGGYQSLGFFSPHQLAFLWMFWFLYYTNDNHLRNLSKINQSTCVIEKRRSLYNYSFSNNGPSNENLSDVLLEIQPEAKWSPATNIKSHFSISSLLQCQSRAVVCVNTPRMYPRSSYFLVNIICIRGVPRECS